MCGHELHLVSGLIKRDATLKMFVDKRASASKGIVLTSSVGPPLVLLLRAVCIPLRAAREHIVTANNAVSLNSMFWLCYDEASKTECWTVPWLTTHCSLHAASEYHWHERTVNERFSAEHVPTRPLLHKSLRTIRDLHEVIPSPSEKCALVTPKFFSFLLCINTLRRSVSLNMANIRSEIGKWRIRGNVKELTGLMLVLSKRQCDCAGCLALGWNARVLHTAVYRSFSKNLIYPP